MIEERRLTLGYAVVLTVVVGALAGVLARMTVLVPLDPAASTVEARLGAALLTALAVVVLGLFLASITVVPAHDVIADRADGSRSAWLVPGCLLACALLTVGFVGVQPFAGEFAEAHTETYGGFGGPNADFDVTTERAGDDRAMVTFTHAGGDPIHAERLHVRGEGFADVDGADHGGPGVWRGTVGGERPRRGGPAVVEGDSVTVGVTDDCMVGLVYEEDGESSFVAAHPCEEPPDG